jgi:translation elongation factor EF-1alpha
VAFLHLLGVREVCVAVSKMDLVGFAQARFEEVRSEVASVFAARGAAPPLSFVPISAALGKNIAGPCEEMPWHGGPTLLEALDALPAPAAARGPLRFPVQDTLSVEGKAVAVGRVEAGSLRRGMPVEALPSGQPGRIEEILRFGIPEVESAGPGDCVGVVFPEGALARGQVLVSPGTGQARSELEATLFWFQGECRDGEQVMVRCSTQSVRCRIELLGKCDAADLETWVDRPSRLECGDLARARLRCETPMTVDAFVDVPELGRFGVEKGGVLVGGGVVAG